MTKKESQNGSTMGISHYTINEKVSKTRISSARRVIHGILVYPEGIYVNKLYGL